MFYIYIYSTWPTAKAILLKQKLYSIDKSFYFKGILEQESKQNLTKSISQFKALPSVQNLAA